MLEILKMIKEGILALPEAWRESAKEAAFRPARPATDRLNELSATVATITPRLVGERIGSILRDELGSLDVLPLEQYRQLMRSLVRSIENVLRHILVFWDGHPLYIEDLQEVWISCEPPLEIIDGRSNSLAVLLAQLDVPTLLHVVYFVGTDAYLRALKEELTRQNVLPTQENRVTFVRLSRDAVPDHPIVLYRNAAGSWWGVQGLYHPSCTPLSVGRYRLKAPLPRNWISYLNQSEAEAIACALERFSTGPGR